MFLKRASRLLFLIAIVCVGRGLAQNYAPQVSYQAGTFPIGISTGDFNHDGNLDIVVANFSSNSLSVFLGNGDGTFQPAMTVAVGTNPISIAVADFDGDGNLDLAVGLQQSPGLQLLMGKGDGTFSPAVTLPGIMIGSLTKVVTADFNDDGRPDLAVAGINGLDVLLNTPRGTFALGEHIAGVASDVMVADLNRDGHPDLVYMLLESAACGVEGVPFLQLGNDDGTFQIPTQLPVTLSDPLGMAAADFNKDERLDLVLVDRGFGTCPSGSITNGSVQILLQQSDGSFRASATISSVVHPDGVAVGDFDGDGNPDLAILQAATAGVTPVPADAVLIYMGDGTGQFSGPHQCKVGGGPEGLVVAPLTNTGALDIAVSDAGSDSMSVLVNQGANTVTLSSSSNPSAVFGQVALTATVQPKFPGSGALSGSITFTDGGTTLGTSSVNSSGTANLSVTFTAVGDHPLEAVFSGSASFVGGSSGSLSQVVNRAVPSVALTSLLNPSLFGQSVSFHVAVSAVPSGTIPTGSVSLNSGDLTIGVAVLDATGKAVITVTSLPAGQFVLTAVYSGDAKYVEAFSASVVQTVNKSPAASTLVASPNPSIFGQSVTFTAVVTAAGGGSGTPSGVVVFTDGGKSIGAANLDGTGKASLAVSSLGAGNHTITASYAGDGNFLASVSPTVPLTVNKSDTTTTLSSTPKPSVFGQSVILTVAVTASGGGARIPSGTVTIHDGTTTLGTSIVDGVGKATLTVSSLAVGSHSISVNYAGDADFNASSATGATGVTQTVNQSSTATSISSSANPAVFGQTITLTAAVDATGGGSGTPAGSVTFRDGALPLGTTTLDAGAKATITLSSLAVGAHSITASYGGSVNYLASVSGALAETVNKNSVVITVTSSLNPSAFGQAVTFALQVVAAVPGGNSGTPVPTGSVILSDNGTVLSTAILDSAGKTAVTTTGLTVGVHNFLSNYSGDQNFLSGTSVVLMQSVNKAPTVTLLASSANPTTNASSITLTAITSASNGTPSGNVTFSDGSTQLQLVPIDKNGSTVLTLSNLPIGVHVFTAVYDGDGNFAVSQAAALNESVVDSHSAVTLNSSANPQTVTEALTFVATVRPALGGVASGGTVTFSDGGTILSIVPVKNSVSSLTTTALPVGDHRITAAYQGSTAPGPFDGVSPVFPQTINPADPVVIIGGKGQDFTIAVSQPNGQLSAGQTFTADVLLTPVNGLTGQVGTLCAGTPERSTCSVSADASVFDGKTSISAKLVVTTTGPSAAALFGKPRSPHGLSWAAMGLSLGLGLTVLPFVSKRSRRFALIVAASGALAGCGGTTFKSQTLSGSTPPGTYTINVQSQSGSLVHSAPVVLVVK
jgi:hypothetical protein